MDSDDAGPLPRSRGLRAWRPVLTPLALAAVVAPFAPWRAVALAGVGVAIAGLVVGGIDVAGAVARVGGAVARAVGSTVGGLVYLVLVVPGWLVTRTIGRDVLRGHHRSGWVPTVGESDPATLRSASPATGATRAPTGRLAWAVGTVVLVMIADYGAGWAWDLITRPAVETGTGADGTRPRDPRVDSPAMAAYPWREDYFADFQRPNAGYWPFTENRPEAFRSEHINIDDAWRRRTREPRTGRDGTPVVWMFGGSTTWGEGQRDEHTIASALVLLADDAGLPITVVNYGQRGWTHFQEMVLFEQRLAQEPRPDIAVFYDGANEGPSQSLIAEPVPSHTLVADYARELGDRTIATGLVRARDDDGLVRELWRRYREHSILSRLAGRARPGPAGADDGDVDDGGPERGADGQLLYDVTDDDGRRAGRVYERAKALTRDVAERSDVDTLFLWQPVAVLSAPYRAAIDELSEDTIDISDVLADHPEVYLDGAHTNEEGARIVAEAIWPLVRPNVEAWYADR